MELVSLQRNTKVKNISRGFTILQGVVYKAEQERKELTHLHPSGASRRPGARAVRGLQAVKAKKQNHIAQAQAPGHTANQKGKMDMSREDYFQKSTDDGDFVPRHLGLNILRTAIQADMANMTPEQKQRLDDRLERDLQVEVSILKAACSTHEFGEADIAKRMQSLVKWEIHKHVEVPNFLPKC